MDSRLRGNDGRLALAWAVEELVEKGYLGRLPTDPFTGSNETWREVQETSPPSPTQKYLGIIDVHSGSAELSLAGTPYGSW